MTVVDKSDVGQSCLEIKKRNSNKTEPKALKADMYKTIARELKPAKCDGYIDLLMKDALYVQRKNINLKPIFSIGAYIVIIIYRIFLGIINNGECHAKQASGVRSRCRSGLSNVSGANSCLQQTKVSPASEKSPRTLDSFTDSNSPCTETCVHKNEDGDSSETNNKHYCRITNNPKQLLEDYINAIFAVMIKMYNDLSDVTNLEDVLNLEMTDYFELKTDESQDDLQVQTFVDLTGRYRSGSSNVSFANSYLQQTKVSPASEKSPRTLDSFTDWNRPCSETETCVHKNEEGDSSETNNEHYSRITNTKQLLQDSVTIKMFNDLPETANPEVVLSQKVTEYSELKTGESQDDLQAQPVVRSTGRYRSGSQDSGTCSASSGCRTLRSTNTSLSCRSGSPRSRSGSPSSRSGSPSSRSGSPRSRSGSPSSRSGSPRSRSGSPSSRSGSPSSRSGSPSSRSGSPRSRSWSPSSRSGSPSSRSGSPSLGNDVSEHSHDISCSRKEQLFAWTDEGTKETTSLLDSGTPLAGTEEYDTGYAGDIALGQNCVGEEALEAGLICKLLLSYNQGIYDTLENDICKQNLRHLEKTVNDGLLGKSVNNELSGKVVSGEGLVTTACDEFFRETVSDELLGKTATDELSWKTVSDELSGKTATDELSWKTVSDELSGKTATDELSWKTVSDELLGKTATDELSWKTVSDELLGKTATDELSWKTVSDELLGKTATDELSWKTVSDELSGKTATDELSWKTVSDELLGKTATDELSWKTVSDELLGKTATDELSWKTVSDELLGKTATDELSWKTVSDELLGKTATDELSWKTVSDELLGKTATDELSWKTVSDELLGKTATDELSWKTVSDELLGKTATDEFSWKTVSDELLGKTAIDELSTKTVGDELVELSRKSDIVLQDLLSILRDTCTFVLPDVGPQPKVKHPFRPSYERNIHDKWRVTADMDTDYDKDNESSDTDDVECSSEYFDNCKEGKDEDAVEEAMKNIDIHNNFKSSFKGREFCKPRTENMPYRLTVKNEYPEGINRKSLWLPSFKENWSLFPDFYRKVFPEGQDLSGTEATNDVPRKSNRFQALTDNQFEENDAECTETQYSNILSKAVGSRTAEDKSRMCCNCSQPQRCCHTDKDPHSHKDKDTHSHKDKDTHSHKEVSTFDTLEKTDQAVSRSGTKEMRDQDLEHCLESLVKFDPDRHMPWRHDIQIFHLEQPADTRILYTSSLYIFMNFEVFRLSSFGFNKFHKDRSILVTRLAKYGFYFMSLKEQIICFGCGSKFEEAQDSSLSSTDSIHLPQCTRHASNKPLDLWGQGLNLDALANYFIENESLTPYLLEPPSAVTASSESGASNNVLKAGPVPDLNMFTNDLSSGYESDALTDAESNGETSGDDHLSVNSSNDGHPFEHVSINESCSLPANLNHISGVVGEERFDSYRSHLVLTSATRQPVWSGSIASAHSEDSSEAAPEGTVGDILSLNLGSAAYPHFSIQAVRRESFTVWNPQHSHRPEDLAAAGFFYAGYMDCVRCFYCGLGLKFWRPGDIPAYQHAKYRPHCRFNILYKGQDYIDHVQQELRSEQQGVRNTVQNQMTPAQPQESLQTSTAPVVGGPQVQDYLNSEAAKDAARNGWTTDQVRQAVSHIVSVYGESCLEIGLLTDILTHFSTNDEASQNQASSSSSSSSDPGINSTMSPLTTPHASSAALANALTMGHNEQDSREGNQRMQDEATPAGASNVQQPEARVPNPEDVLRSVEREHRLLEERVTCRLCKLNPVSCIYLPCGHVIACQDCADNATHCVFCKKTIIGTANVFLS